MTTLQEVFLKVTEQTKIPIKKEVKSSDHEKIGSLSTTIGNLEDEIKVKSLD